jgi:nucleotide-binding universal stress UspA family protein
MPIRDLLVFIQMPLEPEAARNSTPAIDQALALARAQSAHVTFALSAPRISAAGSVVYPSFASSLIAEANAKAETAASAFAEKIRKAAANAEVTCDISTTIQDLSSASSTAAALARCADIAVIDRPGTVLEPSNAVFTSLLFEGSGPLLVVPPNRPASTEFRKLLLAWDGSDHAARAVRAALASFAPPAEIEIVTVTGEKDLQDTLPAATIAKHIARHGVATTGTNLTLGARSVGATLEDHASAVGADLIVMGAYAHSRWRQMLLGGVTDHLTRQSSLPLFLAY